MLRRFKLRSFYFDVS